MFKSTKEFNDAMFRILESIRDGKNFRDGLEESLGNENFDDALERCIKTGLVTGLSPQRVASGNLVIDIIGNPRLTFDGLKFLENYKAS